MALPLRRTKERKHLVEQADPRGSRSHGRLETPASRRRPAQRHRGQRANAQPTPRSRESCTAQHASLIGEFTMLLTFDPIYWLMLAPAMLLGLWAQVRVKSAFARAAAGAGADDRRGGRPLRARLGRLAERRHRTGPRLHDRPLRPACESAAAQPGGVPRPHDGRRRRRRPRIGPCPAGCDRLRAAGDPQRDRAARQLRRRHQHDPAS